MTYVEDMLGKHQELFFMYGMAHSLKQVHELLIDDEEALDCLLYELYENGSTSLFERLANAHLEEAEAFKQEAFGKSEGNKDAVT